MCWCTDSVWSRWTPRFLTEDLNGMRLPLMSTLSLPAELRREVDAMGRTSVFSAFSLSLLLYIQPTDFQRRSGYHREAAEIDREGPPLTTGYHQRICDNHTSRGDISSQRGAESTTDVNRIGPRTELCGTPNWRGLGEDKTLSTFADRCSRPSK